MAYKQLVRRVLFRLGKGDPEIAHERTVAGLRRLSSVRPALSALHRYFAVDAPTTVFGLRFPNPVGLAAGMDKNGVALAAWPALGFGFVEVGTVTQHAQPGNDKPRLFRLPASDALINRMGFNNEGAAALAQRLRTLGGIGVPLGISIGKSKITPVGDAVEDYVSSLRELYPYGDYFAVNVSSPNTPGLRSLQDRGALGELLAELRGESLSLARQHDLPRRPLLVKIAPDLSDEAIAELLDVCAEHAVDGLIATNTTLSRDGLAAPDAGLADQAGGLSGRPLAARAREVVALAGKLTGGELPIIGVGGIHSPDDAARMLDAGASLVQVFTGFVYEGPMLVRSINRSLAGRPGAR
ncbi:dihydroorotate oxidase A [Herbihabitans rhizosphaerae]|uniref:Dihydroorotate dehydrogenase (quinone) n=1 Tax=Herbihabitans rhizosphaerae TaxID=1872711 RepID=A0A4V2ES14_9PSEU|nr:quinone-dependent dihydroorotate dehydrogenase [Herbihabitans rhizosphaerae]RZS34777.1 dihydroorotate oxidase A [Herbihabitans rhizosphaerae]